MTSYGEVTVEKQSKLIRELSTARSSERSKKKVELIAAVPNVARQGKNKP